MPEVFASFDESLFRYLLPPGSQLLRFDGSSSGDIVHLRLFSKTEWISEITESSETSDHCYFVDRGMTIPRPLVYWRHIHHVWPHGPENSRIEDEMEYRTSNKILDLIIFPFLYFAFLPRVWQYRKYFNTLKKDKQSIHSHK